MAVQLTTGTEFARTRRENEVKDARVAGRRVAEYRVMDGHHTAGHDHSLDAVVGYVVRETVGLGDGALWRDAAGARVNEQGASRRCGYDVAAVDGGDRYADTITQTAAYRAACRYAVTDSLYACGCRSGR